MTTGPVGAQQEAPTVGSSSEAHEQSLMGTRPNLRRIVWTGTIWFVVAVVAVAIFVGLLLASGWRPAVLPLPDQTVW